jgi:hypothetical protein
VPGAGGTGIVGSPSRACTTTTASGPRTSMAVRTPARNRSLSSKAGRAECSAGAAPARTQASMVVRATSGWGATTSTGLPGRTPRAASQAASTALRSRRVC